MNLDRGMQRLAVFAGILGMVAGGVKAYSVLRSVPSERYQHKVFEELAALDVVKQAKANPFNRLVADPDIDALARKYGGTVVMSGDVNRPKCPDATPIENERIEQVFWGAGCTAIDFFAMKDGGIVMSGPAPSGLMYWWGIAYPLLGFAIAWATVSVVAWVISGFLTKA